MITLFLLIKLTFFRLYCRYEYNSKEFSSKEMELRHFLTRISQKNSSWNKWPPPRFYSESYYCKYKNY